MFIKIRFSGQFRSNRLMIRRKPWSSSCKIFLYFLQSSTLVCQIVRSLYKSIVLRFDLPLVDSSRCFHMRFMIPNSLPYIQRGCSTIRLAGQYSQFSANFSYISITPLISFLGWWFFGGLLSNFLVGCWIFARRWWNLLLLLFHGLMVDSHQISSPRGPRIVAIAAWPSALWVLGRCLARQGSSAGILWPWLPGVWMGYPLVMSK